MKRLTLVLALSLFGCVSPGRFTKVAKDVTPSVVKIESMVLVKGKLRGALGTGVLITPNGHILTCAHVVDKTVLLRVSFPGGSGLYGAKVLQIDRSRDLALLQLPGVLAPYVRLAPRMPEIGEEVVAIGHPYGLTWSVTNGIVSGFHREGLAVNLMQTDTAINPGNSGGPLLNLSGELVGINESIVTESNGLGFAVSIEEIRRFLWRFKGLEVAQ